MYARYLTIAAILLTALPGMAPAGEPAGDGLMLYVSPQGNDTWSGTLAEPNQDKTGGPKATVAGARDAIRALRAGDSATGPVTVRIREGVYRITEPIVLEPQDSGAPGAPVVYEAYPGEQPVISGGRPLTGWKQEGKLWRVDLPEVKSGGWEFSSIWVDGGYRHAARIPNEGYLKTAGKAPAIQDPETGKEIDRSKTSFKFHEGDIQHWQNLDDVWVVVMHSWDTSHRHIAEIDDENNIVTFDPPVGWAYERWGPDQRYFIEHVFEGLDAPGEWYLNEKTGAFYYYPMEGEDPATTEVIASVAPQLLVFQGDLENGEFVEHVQVRGISFQHTGYTLGPQGIGTCQAVSPVHGAIHANGAHGCIIEDCEVANISNYAIWFREGCRNNRVVRNHIHGMGAGGVRFGNMGDPKNEHAVTAYNTADNNWIHDGGKRFPAAVGVWIGRSSYNTVSHNEIADFFYTGVSVGWSWGYQPSSANHNIIEYNHIHHIGKYVLSDMGGIYTLGVAPGTILRYNRIHDVFSYAYGGWGIYPDEGSSGLLIENNVVYNTKTGTFHQHYGKENRVRNNIFAYSHQGQIIRSREEEHVSFIFRNNIVYYNNNELLGSNWNNGNFRMDWNCYWREPDGDADFKGMTLDEWQEMGFDTHSIIADPLFVDPRNFDFTLRPGSPAVEKLQFKPIDISGAGLYGDPEWVNGPRELGYEPHPLPVPPPPPEPIQDDFESTAVGEPPAGASVHGTTDEAGIAVTEETAASGKRSVKFVDAPGLQQQFNPHMYYEPRFRKGRVVASFDMRFEPGMVLYHEWRHHRHKYRVGPRFSVTGDGQMALPGVPPFDIPHGEWLHIAIRCGLGLGNEGSFDIAVTLPGGEEKRFEGLKLVNPDFRRFDWCGFVADGNANAVAYLDNVNTRVE